MKIKDLKDKDIYFLYIGFNTFFGYNFSIFNDIFQEKNITLKFKAFEGANFEHHEIIKGNFLFESLLSTPPTKKEKNEYDKLARSNKVLSIDEIFLEISYKNKKITLLCENTIDFAILVLDKDISKNFSQNSINYLNNELSEYKEDYQEMFNKEWFNNLIIQCRNYDKNIL